MKSLPHQTEHLRDINKTRVSFRLRKRHASDSAAPC